jgi:hypothetical protein
MAFAQTEPEEPESATKHAVPHHKMRSRHMMPGTTIGMSSGEGQGGGLAVSQFRASLPEAEPGTSATRPLRPSRYTDGDEAVKRPIMVWDTL